MLKIKLPDDSILKVKEKSSAYDVAKLIGERLAKDAIAAEVNGVSVDLNRKIKKDCEFKIITQQSKEALDILNHSAAHVLVTAAKDLYPKIKPTIGPSIDPVGFYYDFHSEIPFNQDDLNKMEERMKELISQDINFQKVELSVAEAQSKFSNNKFKLELLSRIDEGKISHYQIGQNGYLDLCKGPHIPSTGKIRAIKLLNVSSAYWKGDPDNVQLQRVYGVAFFKKEDLTQYLDRIEEAEKRDHRVLGPQLDLFDTAKEYGPGMPLFYPKGTVIWDEIEKFWREEHKKAGYDLVRTPHLFRAEVWEKSGHLEYYKENMFPVKVGDEDWYVKPMNCPGHMMIYNRKSHSYKELPIRLGEFGTVYRYELSGTLHGLLRVRGFTQDDSHIFMMPEQLEDEILAIINMVDRFYKIFGFEEWIFNLSTRPEKSIGSKKIWEHATQSLKKALAKANKIYKVKEGEGAFYGPKIDIDVKDSLGRMWQLATIQVDFNLPERFDITYMGENGKRNRPVVIHRVIFGAVDRFLGILIEHYRGKLPMWLCPIQVIIIPITDRNIEYAKKVKKEIVQKSIRIGIDLNSERMEYKIREAQLKKIPYMVIIGDKEEKSNTITIRKRNGNVKKGIKIQDFIHDLREKIAEYR